VSTTPFDAPASDAEGVPADELPSAVDLIQDGLKVFMDDVGPFALGGLGITLVGMGAGLIVSTLSLGCLFGGFFLSAMVMAGGGSTGSDELAAAGGGAGLLLMLVSYLGFFIVLFAGLAITTAPFNGSLMRAVDEHLAGGEKVSFGSAFDTAFKQPVKDIVATFGFMIAMVLGVFVLYVGALFSAFFLSWWPISAHVDGLGTGAAASRSFSHAKDNLVWHLGVFGLGIGVGLIANYIPVLGPMFLTLYHVKAYRAAYPRPADPDILV